ncbi:hypothetical protein [Spirosoma validum]|uniref:Lipocalin-like domain-containing protein n=1 Tax=Spirosoma validum TaxID=2771355 RepID=A0A927B4T1_9BACT|nr:hypothetical protein [Spirosoma validum]MBD2755368.1 hypothetical protein [Spirosoma validum]
MKINKLHWLALLVIGIGTQGCKKMNEELFPLAGTWKPAAERTTRIQYVSGGQTYDKAYTKTVTPSTTLLVFGKDGTFTEGSSNGTYALETINGEQRVALTSASGNSQSFAYELNGNVLNMNLVSVYEKMSATDRLTVGKAMGAGLSSAAFPGLSSATSVKDIRVTFKYTRQ